jgi:hypothetical protein
MEIGRVLEDIARFMTARKPYRPFVVILIPAPGCVLLNITFSVMYFQVFLSFLSIKARFYQPHC